MSEIRCGKYRFGLKKGSGFKVDPTKNLKGIGPSRRTSSILPLFPQRSMAPVVLLVERDAVRVNSLAKDDNTMPSGSVQNQGVNTLIIASQCLPV